MFYNAVVSLKDSVNDDFDGLFKQSLQVMMDLWDQVKCVLSVSIDTDKDIAVQRSSNEWNIQLIQNSTRYLEKQYVQYLLHAEFVVCLSFLKHMETVIDGNREQARRGGVPGNIALVQAFLNVRFPNSVARFEVCIVFC
jgi:hypothetical protein